MNLESKIEAILFYKNEGVKLKKLVEFLGVTEEEIIEALDNLDTSLSGRGIVLQRNEDEVMLGTNPQMSETIEQLQKDELNKSLSKASLETLSIILYKNGATRADIDYIRGVNSSFTLRALSVRGLVEKVADSKDNRRYLYKPTFELLSFMGVRSVAELPNYEETLKALLQTELDLQELENENKENNKS